MMRLTRNTLVWITLAATALYIGASWLVPTPVLIELLNGLFLGLAFSVSVVFAPLLWRAIKVKRFDRVAQLTVGIILTWISLALSRLASVVGVIVDRPGSMVGSHIVGLAAYLAVLGGILHITAPGMFEDRLQYNRGILVFAFVVGLGIAAATIFLQRQ